MGVVGSEKPKKERWKVILERSCWMWREEGSGGRKLLQQREYQMPGPIQEGQQERDVRWAYRPV